MGRRPGFDILLPEGRHQNAMRSGCPPDVVWRRGFPKGIFRLRVSSVLKYAFAWNVKGSRPVVTKDVRYSACSPVKGPSFLHTAGVNDGWLFNQRGSTVRVSRTATPCMVYPPVVDILRRVQVSMASTITLRTPKVVTITGSHRTTRRTSLAGLVCIDLLDTNTSTFGFVRERINRRTGIQHSLSSGREFHTAI